MISGDCHYCQLINSAVNESLPTLYNNRKKDTFVNKIFLLIFFSRCKLVSKFKLCQIESTVSNEINLNKKSHEENVQNTLYQMLYTWLYKPIIGIRQD